METSSLLALHMNFLTSLFRLFPCTPSMMKEGGKATLVIPSDLAYGDGGSGDTIPPGATLKFEVELFRVS